jgi:hypothetical protein
MHENNIVLDAVFQKSSVASVSKLVFEFGHSGCHSPPGAPQTPEHAPGQVHEVAGVIRQWQSSSSSQVMIPAKGALFQDFCRNE